MLVTQPQESPPLPRCGLFRRLAAILYDGLLLLAVLFFASALLLPFSDGEAVAANRPLLSIYFFVIAFGFYSWFWTHGGQTLGMRAWRIRLQGYDGTSINLWQALLRYLAAVVSWVTVGIGFFWCLVDRHQLTWHDRFSMSELVVLPKQGRE